MAKGSCGSATEPSNVLDMAEDEDLAHLTLLYQWDGTSTWPNCAGPFTTLTLRNDHDVAWEAVFDRTGTDHSGDNDIVTINMDSHSVATISTTDLAALGLVLLSDVGGASLQPKSS